VSQENVEVLRRMIDAFNRGDRDEALADYAAEVE
jgi:ketosteroid isomerase-like protein